MSDTTVPGMGWPHPTSGGPSLPSLGWVNRTSDPVPRETAVTAPASRPDASRTGPVLSAGSLGDSFGPTPAPGTREYQKAGDLVDLEAMGDHSTPLAAAVAQQVSQFSTFDDTGPFERPRETRVFVVANQKGGVGKTTSTVNLAATMAQRGQRVLVVDLDPQGNASTALRIDHTQGTDGVYEAIVDGMPLVEVIRECPDIPGLKVVPASIDLAGAEIELVSLVARESRLRRSVDAYLEDRQAAGEQVDYVFIDCPPSLGLLTVNALVAGREMLIPIQCEYYALEGLGQLMHNVDLIKAHLNPGLQVTTILLTMHDARTRLSAGVADEVRQYFGELVLHTAIPRSVRISEAPSYQQSVMTYDPTSPGSLSYLEAAREIAEAHAGPATGERATSAEGDQ